MKHQILEALSANIRPGVWYVRRINPKAGGNDERYWIVTNPSEVMDKFRAGEVPNRNALGRTFPRDQWRAALDWAIERSRGGRLPMTAPRPRVVPTGGLPAGPSGYFQEEGQWKYPEQSGGAVQYRGNGILPNEE